PGRNQRPQRRPGGRNVDHGSQAERRDRQSVSIRPRRLTSRPEPTPDLRLSNFSNAWPGRTGEACPRRLTMNRCLAFLLALMFATISVSSACVAGSPDWIGFTLRPEQGDGARIHASFRDEDRDRDRNSWSTG